MNIANSIWLKDADTFHVEDDFLRKNTELFDAEIYQAPFDDSTLKDINTWVSNKTEKMIPEILDQIEYDSVMYLINAVAFDANGSLRMKRRMCRTALLHRKMEAARVSI